MIAFEHIKKSASCPRSGRESEKQPAVLGSPVVLDPMIVG
jgi:hypothetical protein